MEAAMIDRRPLHCVCVCVAGGAFLSFCLGLSALFMRKQRARQELTGGNTKALWSPLFELKLKQHQQ